MSTGMAESLELDALKRDARGRFKKQRGWYLSSKGYPRFSSGPLRGKYVHRVVMEKKLGRPLRDDEDVHHKDGDKTNFKLRNLKVLGHREHGYVSAKQHWYVDTIILPVEKKAWDEYFDSQGESNDNSAGAACF
jgi:hypothetical protein